MFYNNHIVIWQMLNSMEHVVLSLYVVLADMELCVNYNGTITSLKIITKGMKRIHLAHHIPVVPVLAPTSSDLGESWMDSNF